ncbi:MAG: AraC family transcriptional regulator [Pseudomonadota bacterium]
MPEQKDQPLPVSPDLQALPASLSAAWVNDALATVQREYGIAPAELLAQAGVDAQTFANPTALVPLIDVVRLFACALGRTGDNALGLRLGGNVQPRSYPVLGYVIMGSADLGEAIDRLLRFERIVGELGRASLDDEGADNLLLRWDCPVPMPYARYLRDAAVAGWVGFARSLLDNARAPLEARFEHPEPPAAEREAYERFFRCPVRFSAPHTGIVFPRVWLQLPLRSADPALGGIMEEHAARLLADFSSGINLANEVRSAIYRHLPGGEPEIETVAEDLGMTVRALQARLRKADVTFSDLVDDIRKSLAAVLVADERLTLVNVALLLGFAEQSSFTRAFRRWYGMAPGEYRKNSG